VSNFGDQLPKDLRDKIEKLRSKNGTGIAEQIELPLWPEDKKAMPNELARASLFVPTARGRRKMLDKVQLAAPAGIVIEFTGKQLDMSDCDVFLLSLRGTLPVVDDLGRNRFPYCKGPSAGR